MQYKYNVSWYNITHLFTEKNPNDILKNFKIYLQNQIKLTWEPNSSQIIVKLAVEHDTQLQEINYRHIPYMPTITYAITKILYNI